jgi:hypothetical protein
MALAGVGVGVGGSRAVAGRSRLYRVGPCGPTYPGPAGRTASFRPELAGPGPARPARQVGVSSRLHIEAGDADGGLHELTVGRRVGLLGTGMAPSSSPPGPGLARAAGRERERERERERKRERERERERER